MGNGYENEKKRRRARPDWLEYQRAVNRRFGQAHPEAKANYHYLYRYGFTKLAFKELCESYNNRCLACGGVFPLATQKNKQGLVPDHVNPISKGGGRGLNNVQPLCNSCNVKKGSKVIDYRKVG